MTLALASSQSKAYLWISSYATGSGRAIASTTAAPVFRLNSNAKPPSQSRRKTWSPPSSRAPAAAIFSATFSGSPGWMIRPVGTELWSGADRTISWTPLRTT